MQFAAIAANVESLKPGTPREFGARSLTNPYADLQDAL